MITFNSTSNILIAFSILAFGILFFVALALPDSHEIIKFGYDTSFLFLIIGNILRQKSIQQLIGLSLYIVVYNLDLFKYHFFQIQNDDILYFARRNAFYVIVVSLVFLLPTLFDNYKLAPLTNRTKVNDSTIILTCIGMTILIQATIRLTV